MLKLGVHVNKKSSVLDDKTDRDVADAIKQDTKTLGLNCAQIFLYGPQKHQKINIDVDDVLKVTSNLDISVHSSYSSTMIWQAETNPSVCKRIEQQLKACDEILASYLIVHVCKISPDTLINCVNILAPMLKKYNCTMLLEMVASKACELTYETPEKINFINDRLKKYFDSGLIGWCVDTAHLWGAGVDCRSASSMKKWLSNIKNPSYIKMFHLNGSSTELGSGRDKHEIPFCSADLMWHTIDYDNSAVKVIKEFSIKYNIVIIAEINRGTEKEVRKFLSLML